jgi:hypothetical protein
MDIDCADKDHPSSIKYKKIKKAIGWEKMIAIWEAKHIWCGHKGKNSYLESHVYYCENRCHDNDYHPSKDAKIEKHIYEQLPADVRYLLLKKSYKEWMLELWEYYSGDKDLDDIVEFYESSSFFIFPICSNMPMPIGI